MVLLVPLAVIFLGVALHMALRLVYGARGASENDTLFVVGRVLSWCLMGGGALLWTAVPMLMAWPLWLLVAFALVDSLLAARDAARRTNCKLLAIAAQEQNLPEAARLLDEVSSGRYVGEAAGGLAYQLHRGTPLYESVAGNPGALPREAAAYAAIGTLAEDPVEALNELSRPDDSQLATAWRRWCDQAAYGSLIVIALAMIMAFCLMFVVPQFREIFWEFDVALPPMTEFTMGLADPGSFGWFLVSFLLLGCSVLLFGGLIVSFCYLVDMHVLRGPSDWLLRNRHTASVLRLLALAVAGRVDLSRAFYALSVTHPARNLRTRLSDTYQDIAAGQKWSDVMVHNRLLSANEKALVETAEQAGNLPWALRQIAHRREAQLATRLEATANLVYPLFILAIGLLIGFIVISLFIPLVKLTEGLA